MKGILMKRFFLIMLFAYSNINFAQDLKLCTYDPDQIMEKSVERKFMIDQVDNNFQKMFETMQKEEAELKEAVKVLQNKSSLLSEVARENEQSSLMRKKRDLDAKAERTLEDYKMERQKAEVRFIQTLEKQVAEYSKKQGFDVAIPKSPGVYISPRADKTGEVLKYMNNAYENSKSKTKKFVTA